MFIYLENTHVSLNMYMVGSNIQWTEHTKLINIHVADYNEWSKYLGLEPNTRRFNVSKAI